MLDPEMMRAWRHWRALRDSTPVRQQLGMTLDEWNAEPKMFTTWATEFAKLDGG